MRPDSSLASLRGALCSLPGLGWAQFSAVATLKFFIIFEQGVLHFRFALGSAAGLGGHIPRGAGGREGVGWGVCTVDPRGPRWGGCS